MAKPKDLTKEKDLEKDEAAEVDAQPGSGETMRVQIAGPASAVTRRLGITPGEGADPKEKPGAGADKASDKFFELMQDAALVAVVSRTWPPTFNGIQCRAEVERFPLPEDWQSIKDQVRETHGGGKYRAALTNPQNGRTLAAERFEIPGDPILPMPEEFDGDHFEEEEVERTPLEKVKDLAEKEIANATTEAELIAARRQLAALRDGKGSNGADPRIEQLERKIADAEKRALEEKHEREIAELKRQIEAKAAPAGESSSDKMFALMMQQMKAQTDMALAQQKSSDEKFSKMMEQMQNQKLDSISAELREIKRTKDEGGLKGQIEMVKTIADLLGVPLGGDKDEDDEDKPWYEKLAEDSLPRILDILDGKRKEGKEVSKEQLIAEIEKEADRVIAERTAAGHLPAPPRPAAPAAHPAQPRALPPAPPGAGALPPPAPGGKPGELPPPPPEAGAPTPPAQLPSVEEERAVRCANVMMILERELMFRPRDFQWNFTAWKNLPAEILEKFSTATDLPAALTAFDGVLNPAGLEQMRARITADDKVKAWVARGFKELQGWWQESLKNPDFDPANEGAEEDGDDL